MRDYGQENYERESERERANECERGEREGESRRRWTIVRDSNCFGDHDTASPMYALLASQSCDILITHG